MRLTKWLLLFVAGCGQWHEDWALPPTVFERSAPRLLVYFGFDNDLAPELPRDLNALEAMAGRFPMAAQADLPGKGSTYRYVPVADQRPRKVVTPALSIPEINSAHPGELIDFLAWGGLDDPSRTVLDIATHGSAYQGVIDDFTSQSIMPLDQLRMALLTATGGQKLGMLSFSACVMANLETMWALRGVADVVVASEDLIDLNPLEKNYYRAFEVLGQEPGMAMSELGRHVVQTAGAFPNFSTLSAIRLDAVSGLTRTVDQLARELLRLWPEKGRQAAQALQNLPRYDQDKVDIGLLAQRVRSLDPRLIPAADRVLESLSNAVLKVHNKPAKRDRAHGLTLYLPARKIDPVYQQSEFAQQTHWLAVLEQVIHAR